MFILNHYFIVYQFLLKEKYGQLFFWPYLSSRSQKSTYLCSHMTQIQLTAAQSCQLSADITELVQAVGASQQNNNVSIYSDA